MTDIAPATGLPQSSDLRVRTITAVAMVAVIISLFIFAAFSPEKGGVALPMAAGIVVALAAGEASVLVLKRHGGAVGWWFGLVSLLVFSLQLTRALRGELFFGEITGRESLVAGVLSGILCSIPAICARSRSIVDIEAIITAAAIQGLLIIGGGVLMISLVGNGAVFFLMIFSVAANDIAAYAAGRKFGGPRIAPVASPKKTFSGAIGGLLGGTAVWGFGVFLLPWIRFGEAFSAAPHFNSWWVAIPILVGAQLGDIAKSLLKRGVGVKDSGSLLPGHGGFLDRIDGILGALVVVSLLCHL
jgi:phosphatidate cytidylyltransferase